MGSPHTPEKWRLWQPSNAIRFAPPARPAFSPRSPRVSLARFTHGSTPDLASGQPPPVAEVENHTSSQESRRSSAPPSLDPANEQSPDNAGAASSATDAAAEDGAKEPTAETEKDAEAEAEEDELLGPPTTTLPFKMSDDLLRATQLATPGKPESFWSYTLYRGPGDDGTEDTRVKVHYCRSKATTEKVCQYFLSEKVIGLDLEWMPDALKFQGARRNVCLVQIASASRIALFHIALYPKTDTLVAPTLKKILEDSDITKVGVWIRGDCTRLKNFLGIEAKGIFELSHLYRLVKYSAPGADTKHINKRLVPLATMVHEHLHLPMFKGQDVRSSDWSTPLRMDQIIYSASDAYAGVQLYDVMNVKREALDPCPPLPHHAELELPIRLAEVEVEEGEEEMEDLVDEEERQVVDEGEKTPVELDESFLSSAMADLEIEPDAADDAGQGAPVAAAEPPPAAPKPARKAAAPKPAPAPKDARILAAETWASTYRTTHPAPPGRPRSVAMPAPLRAYYIWHTHTDMEPQSLAALLRDPPLQTTTVISYILEAIKLEKLPYAKERLGREVLSLVPMEMVKKRYGKLHEACKEYVSDDGKAKDDDGN